MVAATSRLAYEDAFAILDQALADDRGIRIPFKERAGANHLRARLHQARQIERKENASTYEKGHVMHGRSQYDAICCSIAPDTHDETVFFWLYVEKRSLEGLVIQSLSALPKRIEAYHPMKLIEAPASPQVESSEVKRRV